jgi:serine O-acetyltransferase
MPNAINFYKLGYWFYNKGIPFLPKFLELIIFLFYNSRIPSSAKIGSGSFFAYGGIGCVIHKRAVIGQNVNIGTNVTIGGKSGHINVPVIGNNVFISTGAKILGPIIIGNNVIIGANAVVIDSIPDDCIVAGVPAKIINKK